MIAHNQHQQHNTWLTQSLIHDLSLLDTFDIFTDGSWSETGPAWDHITHNSPTYTGSAGLVIISRADNWMDLPIITLHIYNGPDINAISAYSMELLSIITALHILTITNTTCTIYTDCQAVVKKITKLQQTNTATRANTSDATLLTAAIQHLKSRGQLQWVKGHPERTQSDKTLWTRKMWGNQLADKAAAGSLTKSYYQYNDNSPFTFYINSLPSLDAPTLTPLLSPPNFWYFGKIGGQYTSRSLIDSVHHNRLTTYLQTRDQYRQKANQPPLWQTLNIPLASTLWQLTTNSTSRSLCNRLLFDKHWHGRNQAKAIDDPALHALI
jgi:ribonuclease HI